MGICTFHLCITTMVLVSEIGQAGKASEKAMDSVSLLPKIFKRMQSIQETWLDSSGLAYNLQLCLGVSIFCGCMVVALDIYLIGILRIKGTILATATDEIEMLSKVCFFQLVCNVGFISVALIPALCITLACDEMFKKVNTLAGQLLNQAA